MEHLFAYGTLMCDDILADVAGCRLTGAPGMLRGYQRRAVKGEHYPAIVPHDGGCVEGVVYRDVPASAWERLDRFEGDMYARQRVTVELPDGAPLAAATYVAHPGALDCVDQSEWNLADFMRIGKTAFQQHYKGYQAL